MSHLPGGQETKGLGVQLFSWAIFTEAAQSGFVPLWKTRFPVVWRLLVKERIANIGIPLDILGLLQFK